METENREFESRHNAISAALFDPAFSENLRRRLDALNPESAQAVSKLLVERVPTLSPEVKEALFLTADWLLDALTHVDEQLGKTPLGMWRENSGRIDKERLSALGGKVRTAYSALERSRALEDRETATRILSNFGSVMKFFLEALGNTLTELGKWADFGKVRVALTSHFKRRQELLREPAEPYDPVLLANLLGSLPSLIEYLLVGLHRALTRLSLPSEIFANAPFQLIEEINPQSVANLINTLASMVTTVHEGNVVVGGAEPRSKQFLEQYGKELSGYWDRAVLEEAAFSLREELGIVGKVISEHIFRTPESTAQFVKSLAETNNALLRAVSMAVQQISMRPQPMTSSTAEGLEQKLEVQELGRLSNSLAVIFNRRYEKDASSLGETLQKLLLTIDIDQHATAARTLTDQLKVAALAVPAWKEKLVPEVVGEMLNQRLIAYNTAAEKTDLVDSQISRILAVINTDELSKALNKFILKTVDEMLANPEVSRAISKPMAKGFIKYVKGSIRMPRAIKRPGIR